MSVLYPSLHRWYILVIVDSLVVAELGSEFLEAFWSPRSVRVRVDIGFVLCFISTILTSDRNGLAINPVEDRSKDLPSNIKLVVSYKVTMITLEGI
jgi:hypothetical protein